VILDLSPIYDNIYNKYKVNLLQYIIMFLTLFAVICSLSTAAAQVQPQVTAAIYEPQFTQFDDNLIIANDYLYEVNKSIIDVNKTAVHNETFSEEMERIKVAVSRNANKLQLILEQIELSNSYLKSINASNNAINASSAETASDLSATGPILAVLEKINTASDTISTFVDTIKTAVAAISAFTEGAQYTEAQKQTALLTRIADQLEAGIIREKCLAAVSEEQWIISVEETLALQIDLDFCEYDPLGVGPINCNGLEMEFTTLQGANMIPLP